MDLQNSGQHQNTRANRGQESGTRSSNQDKMSHEIMGVMESEMFDESNTSYQDHRNLQSNINKLSENAKLCLKIEELLNEPLKQRVFAISNEWLIKFKEFSENVQALERTSQAKFAVS